MASEVGLFGNTQQAHGKNVLTEARGEARVGYPVYPSVWIGMKRCTEMTSQASGTTLAAKGSRTNITQNHEYHSHNTLDNSKRYEYGDHFMVSSGRRQSAQSTSSSP